MRELKINQKKYELARARACISFQNIIDAGMAKGTLCRIINGEDVRSTTMGKLAKILKVDVTEIIED